jgi:hypothetical protein
MTEPRLLWVRLETDVWAKIGTDGRVERVVVDWDVKRPFDGIDGPQEGEYGPRGEVESVSDDEIEQLDLGVDHIMSGNYPAERWEVGTIGEVPGTLSKSIYTERTDIWEAALKRGCGHGCHCMTMLRQDLERRGVDAPLRRQPWDVTE